MWVLIAPASAQVLDPGLQTRLQRVVDSMRADQKIPGISAAVLVPGRTLWQGTAGGSHPGTPVAPDMVFGIGSNSKLFTAAAFMKCVEGGRVRIDDPLRILLPPHRNIDPDITVRQLLNHTSGLADVNAIQGYADTILANPDRVFTHDEVLAWVGPPHFPAGTSWEYSNTNYILVGMIVEQVTGRPFAGFLRDSILVPLGLDSTVMDVDEAVVGTVAHPWTGGADISGTARTSLNSAAWCAGAMVSTSGEMAQWYAALFGGRVLRDESLREMTTFVGSGRYGFGISEKQLAGRTVWLHGGSIRGYNSQMMYLPAQKVVIAVLTNETPGSAALVAQQLLEALPGDPLCVEPPDGADMLRVYPNPVTTLLTIEPAADQAAWGLRVSDALGRSVWTGSALTTHRIDATGWVPGVYVIHAGNERRMLIKR